MMKKIILLVIIFVALLLMGWSVHKLISHVNFYQQSVNTEVVAHQSSRGLSQNLQSASLLTLLLSDIYTYIIAAMAIFFSSVIRFYTNLLCQAVHANIKKSKQIPAAEG
ncbi:MAG: hypothetical protein GY821_07105 [Gammaproteobacteria bacterium]|nr:hypothetical protein [Gammaproteobacteria bacterium]